jgi:hypothetical protein
MVRDMESHNSTDTDRIKSEVTLPARLLPALQLPWDGTIRTAGSNSAAL